MDSENSRPAQLPPWLLSAIILGTTLLRLPYATHPLLSIDEAEYAVLAHFRLVPYWDAWFHKPPGIWLFYLAGEFLQAKGGGLFGVHLLLAVWTALTGLVLARIALKLGGRTAAWGAGIGWVIFSSCGPLRDFQAANTELVAALPVSLGWLALAAGTGPLPFFIAGLFFGIGVWLKQQAVWFLPAALWWAFSQGGRRNGSFVGAGLLVAILPLGIIAQIAPDGWTGLVGYGWYYAGTESWGQALVNALTNGGYLLKAHWLLWALAAWGTWSLACRAGNRGLLLWLVAAALATATGGRFLLHYFLWLYPPFCVAGGIAFSGYFQDKKSLLKKLAFAAFIAAGVTAPIFRFQGGTWWPSFQSLLHGTFPDSPAVESQTAYKPWVYPVAEGIKLLSPPESGLFVWGFAPQLYLASERPPATRFLFTNYQTGLAPGASSSFDPGLPQPPPYPGSREALLSDLRANPPALIIDTSHMGYWFYDRFPLDSFPELEAFVRENYNQSGVIDGFVLYRIKS